MQQSVSINIQLKRITLNLEGDLNSASKCWLALRQVYVQFLYMSGICQHSLTHQLIYSHTAPQNIQHRASRNGDSLPTITVNSICLWFFKITNMRMGLCCYSNQESGFGRSVCILLTNLSDQTLAVNLPIVLLGPWNLPLLKCNLFFLILSLFSSSFNLLL